MIYQFPSAYVWSRALPGHEEIKARVLPKIIEEAEQNASNPGYKWSEKEPSQVITTYDRTERVYETFTTQDFYDIAMDSLELFLNSGDLKNAFFSPKYVLSSFWWNRYPEGSTAPPHTHSCGVSGVYFLEQKGPCPLHFMDVNVHSPDPETPSVTHSPEVTEGSVLLFPGSLMHWVEPTTGARTTVSFNFAPVAKS
jgi:hypothetical protein